MGLSFYDSGINFLFVEFKEVTRELLHFQGPIPLLLDKIQLVK